MSESLIPQQLMRITWLLAANLAMLAVGAGAMLFGLLPKVERAVQSTERVEVRFQAFADEVQPVLTVGADKAIESIKNMDAKRLGDSATEKTDSLMESAAERAKRFLEKDKEQEQ